MSYLWEISMSMTVVPAKISMKLIAPVYCITVSKMNTVRSAVWFLMIVRERVVMT